MSTKVTLDAAWKARYPDICVLCGHRGPGDTFSLSTAPTNGWRSIVSPRDERNSSKVPACPRCRQLMERQRQLRSWGVLAAILAALGLYVTLVVCYQGPLVNVVRSGGLAFFLLPYFVWEALFPLPINVTATKKLVTYAFEYEVYAIEFARLNRSYSVESRVNAEELFELANFSSRDGATQADSRESQ